MSHYPALGPAQGSAPDEPDRMALVRLEGAIERLEPAWPGAERCRGRLGKATSELVDAESQPVSRPVRAHHREGDHGLACPAGEVVDVERDETRQEDQLRRQHRQFGPRPQVEQRQPDPGEDSSALDATGALYELRGAQQVRSVHRVTGQPERDVGLDAGREVGRASVEVRPRAVLALARPDPARRRRRQLSGPNAQELAQQEILRVNGDVRLELALPPALRTLERGEGVDGSAETRQGVVGRLRSRRR